MSWNHLPLAQRVLGKRGRAIGHGHLDTHEDRRVEGMGVWFEEMLAKNGPEMRRQSPPTALRELRGKMKVHPHLKAFSIIPENGRQEKIQRETADFTAQEWPLDGWPTWAQEEPEDNAGDF